MKNKTQNSSAAKARLIKRRGVKKEGKKDGIITPSIEKYWFQRYGLFSKYDEGIQMDEEGWYSVTPEEIAIRHAEKCGGHGLVIDCFAGVGVNNARVYGVEDYIDFIVGDFFQLAPSLKGDVAFFAPPWSGPSYKTIENFTIDLLKPKDGYSIFQAAQGITPKVIMFLPRNVNLYQVEELSWLSSPPLSIEMEENYLEGNLKGITVCFGCCA